KRDGKNYLNVTLADKTGRIKGVIWDNAEQIAAAMKSGDFVHILANVNEYRGAVQLVIKKMTACSVDAVDPAEFLPVTRMDVENMFERLLKMAASLEDVHLKALLDAFWSDAEFVRSFKAAPAAKKMHHAYIGGLLEHTLSMAILADKVALHYSGIDRDLLIAGTILHDIGKTRELEYEFKIDYSDQGRLLSHIVIGLEMIEAKLAKVNDFPEERKLLLKHMVVSHHGTQEFGSPEPPKTIEAVLLNYIDEMDSKVKAIRDFMASEDSNESWTSFHRLLGRHFYIGKNKTGL
ncbi:MAG: HD domain-containing protein, partial [Proteobacteria bacterium]|nr:HD domain-containing protein [Pseudomonadota bacterium]